MNNKFAKVDLSLLKKLVDELENSLAAAELMKTDSIDNKDYIVEMSKCSGLASGIMSESTCLVGDIHGCIMSVQGQPMPKDDALAKLLGAIKGGLPGTN